MDYKPRGQTAEESGVFVKESLCRRGSLDVGERLAYGGCGGKMGKVLFGGEVLVCCGGGVEVDCLWCWIIGVGVMVVATV